jgi:hypothetical protein
VVLKKVIFARKTASKHTKMWFLPLAAPRTARLLPEPVQILWRLTVKQLTFFVRDEGIAQQFQRTKNVAEKNRTKGASPTAVFRSP